MGQRPGRGQQGPLQAQLQVHGRALAAALRGAGGHHGRLPDADADRRQELPPHRRFRSRAAPLLQFVDQSPRPDLR